MSSSGFRPFTDPFLRFLQLKATADDIQFRREQQELRREQMRQDIAQQQRQNQVQDFNTKLALRALGGHPALSGFGGQWQALGGGEKIETPVGQYVLPSESQQFERAKTKAKQAGELAGIEQTTKEAITEPFVDVDLGGQIGTVPVPKKDVGRIKIEAYTKMHPELKRESYGPNQDGDYTVIFRNPATQEVVRQETIKGAGKPSSEGSVLTPGRDDEVTKLMNQWRQSYYNQLGITQEDIQILRGEIQTLPVERSAVANRVEAAEAKLRKAAEEKYDKELRPSRSGVERQDLKGQVMPAANVPIGAKRKNMTPEEFQKMWIKLGGTIK